MYAEAYKTYKQQGVLTAGPTSHVVMLYDEAIKQLKLGGLSIEQKDYEKTNQYFQKARRIFMELINSLDFQYKISVDLFNLYEFFVNQTIAMNANKDNSDLERMVGIVSDLRQAWVQADKICRSGRPEP